MPEILKCFKEHLPAARLIGKKYSDEDRNQYGSFSDQWDEWFANGWFEEIEKLRPLPENGDAYLGLMRYTDSFEYWIGMLFPAGTAVPEGYSYADIPEGDIAVCYVYGRSDNGEIFGQEAHDASMDRISREGFELQDNPWYMERYNCPRFTTPDDKGNVILDYCVYIK
jgi:predicted transcriptional regulator YdeE